MCIKVEYSSAATFQARSVHCNLMETDKFTKNLLNLQPNSSLFLSLLILIAVEPTIALSRHTCCLYTLNPRIQVFCSERVAHLQQRGESMNVYPPLSILIATSLASGFGQLTSGNFAELLRTMLYACAVLFLAQRSPDKGKSANFSFRGNSPKMIERHRRDVTKKNDVIHISLRCLCPRVWAIFNNQNWIWNLKLPSFESDKWRIVGCGCCGWRRVEKVKLLQF